MPTTQLLIKGKVQGVFYRATAKKVAEELGVKGWIKNTKDNNVEAIITGTEEQVQQFIKWCKKGPARAEVSDVTATRVDDKNFNEFEIAR
jgi:acylphosphatase